MSIADKKPNKRILTLASVSMAAILAASRPALLSKVYAADNEYDWVKQDQTDRLGGYYSSSARSADGSSLILSVSLGGENGAPEDWVESPLYISNNGGTTWQNIAADIDPEINNRWTSVDVSDDGQVMVVASDFGRDLTEMSDVNGKVMLSEDAGETWSDVTPISPGDWDNVVVSGDGQKIVALETDDDFIHFSENSGATWSSSTIDDVNELKTLSISDSGKIFVGGENGSNPYTQFFSTEDNGDNWENITPDEAEDGLSAPYEASYNTHDVSADGQDIVLATQWGDDSMVFISNDGGNNWTEADPDPSYQANWGDVAISDDGATIAVTADEENGRMFITSDNGAAWIEQTPGQAESDVNTFWQTIDANEDGSKFIVASQENAYLTSVTPTETGGDSAPTVTLSDAEGNKTIKVTTPAGTTITCHSAKKESSLSIKDAAYRYPLGLVDFCFSGAEASNGISILFVTDLKPQDVLVRKYNPNSNAYFTISSAVVSQTSYEGKNALLVTYTITDNGPLDIDPDLGEVADPVGLAVQDIGSPNTGLK